MDILKKNLAIGLGVAAAVTVLVPLVLPALSGAGRPLAKSLLMGGMRLYQQGREAIALAAKSIDDLMTEIRADQAAMTVAPALASKLTRSAVRSNGVHTDADDAAASSVGL
jgi:hypothetical protein